MKEACNVAFKDAPIIDIHRCSLNWYSYWCHDIQHNDIQHCGKLNRTLSITTLSIINGRALLCGVSFMLTVTYAVCSK